MVLVFFTLLIFLPDVASLCQYCGFAPLVLHAEMNDFKVFTFVEFPGLTDTVADKAYLRVKMHTFVENTEMRYNTDRRYSTDHQDFKANVIIDLNH